MQTHQFAATIITQTNKREQKKRLTLVEEGSKIKIVKNRLRKLKGNLGFFFLYFIIFSFLIFFLLTKKIVKFQAKKFLLNVNKVRHHI